MNTSKLVNKTENVTTTIETVITNASVSIFDSKKGNRMCTVILPGAELWAGVSQDAPITDRDKPFQASKIVCRANGLRQGNLDLGTILELWDGQDCVYRDPDHQADLDGQKNGLSASKKAS